MEEGYSLEDIRRGEEKERENWTAKGMGMSPAVHSRRLASLGGEPGGGLSLKYGGRGVLPPFSDMDEC